MRWRQAFGAEDCGPGWRRVAAADKFLVNLFMADAAVCGRYVRGDDEPVVIEFVFFLALLRLVTIEAVDAVGGVFAHLEFVDDRVLLAGVAFGAFPRGLDERGVGLIDLGVGAGALDEESGDNHSAGDDQGDENIAKGQETSDTVSGEEEAVQAARLGS